jgi:hypothetical protein
VLPSISTANTDAKALCVQVDLTDLAEHVDEVTIKASTQPGGDVEPFLMVVDGVRYGPFAEVYVTSHSSDGEPAQLQRTLSPLQVMTYLPLST